MPLHSDGFRLEKAPAPFAGEEGDAVKQTDAIPNSIDVYLGAAINRGVFGRRSQDRHVLNWSKKMFM